MCLVRIDSQGININLFHLFLFLDYEWYLGMNLNPDDDHIMDYTTGWDDDDNIGDTNSALIKDYLSQEVWNMPANRIAIVRHQEVGGINHTNFGKQKSVSKNIFLKIIFYLNFCSISSLSNFYCSLPSYSIVSYRRI